MTRSTLEPYSLACVTAKSVRRRDWTRNGSAFACAALLVCLMLAATAPWAWDVQRMTVAAQLRGPKAAAGLNPEVYSEDDIDDILAQQQLENQP